MTLSKDMLLLLQSYLSRENFFFMIFNAGSTGGDVNNAVISYDVMRSMFSSVIFFICSMIFCIDGITGKFAN